MIGDSNDTSNDGDDDYRVGYGKPPKEGRYPKGVSGNPGGRKKKLPQSLTPGAIIEAIDNEEIEVVENGKRKLITKIEAELQQIFGLAIKGDLSMVRLILDQADTYLPAAPKTTFEYEFIGVTQAKRRFGRGYQKKIQQLNVSRGFRP